MLKLLKYFSLAQWIGLIVMLGLIFLQTQITMAIPGQLGTIINAVTDGQRDVIWKSGGIMFALAISEVFVIIIINYLSSHIGSGFAKTLRHKTFEKVQQFSMDEISGFSTASLITRCTNDIQNVQMTITMSLRMLVTAPLMAISAILKILQSDKQLSLITMIALFVLVALIITCVTIVVPKFKHIQKYTDDINMLARENLTGLRVIRAFNTEDEEEEKFDNTNKSLTHTQKVVENVMNLLFPTMNFLNKTLSLVIVWVGSYLIARNTIDIGTVTTFSQYSVHILMSFLTLSMVFVMIPRALVSANRINEVLQTQVKIRSGTGKTPAVADGSITFSDVSFAYPHGDENVLENINLDIKPGETWAFIGSTGSGKSTLINLIPRFFDVSTGKILVDGMDVRDYNLKELRNKIGYISQKTLLFSGSIRENLLDGNPDATEEDMWEALRIAQAKDFVETLDEGLDYNLSQGSTNVSGGQKQRLSIARALIKKPEILIFDDSFSALDFKTDQELRSTLSTLLDSTTTIIVGQRIGTIMNSDRIVVLDDGKIVGMGTHKELLKNCPVYQQIAYSQISKEELDNA